MFYKSDMVEVQSRLTIHRWAKAFQRKNHDPRVDQDATCSIRARSKQRKRGALPPNLAQYIGIVEFASHIELEQERGDTLSNSRVDVWIVY